MTSIELIRLSQSCLVILQVRFSLGTPFSTQSNEGSLSQLMDPRSILIESPAPDIPDDEPLATRTISAVVAGLRGPACCANKLADKKKQTNKQTNNIVSDCCRFFIICFPRCDLHGSYQANASSPLHQPARMRLDHQPYFFAGVKLQRITRGEREMNFHLDSTIHAGHDDHIAPFE
jgi:hypothetical protein